MSGKDASGSTSTERADWSNAWEVIARLAAARESLEEIAPYRQSSGTAATALSVAGAKADADANNELAQAIAEIEKASDTLRRWEPALEMGLPDSRVRSERPVYWSVWLLIAAIWISAALVVASSVGAVLYLLG